MDFLYSFTIIMLPFAGAKVIRRWMEETRQKRGEIQQTCDRKAPGEREVELILIR